MCTSQPHGTACDCLRIALHRFRTCASPHWDHAGRWLWHAREDRCLAAASQRGFGQLARGQGAKGIVERGACAVCLVEGRARENDQRETVDAASQANRGWFWLAIAC